MGKRILVFTYGLACYAVFLATSVYAIGFVGNLWVPAALDSPSQAPLWRALLTDVGLLGAFAVQHSLMARPAFKRWWTRIVPEPVERSTYVLFSSVLLAALFAYWQPIGGELWNVEDSLGRAAIYGLFASGWLLVLAATFLIDHFDLFGMRQVWFYLRGREYTPPRFGMPGPYRLVRHPLYVGWLLAFWSTPTMTVAHLLFALLTTAYILIAIRLEEGDLVKAHPEYAAYRREVPMLIPRIGRRDDAPTRIGESA